MYEIRIKSKNETEVNKLQRSNKEIASSSFVLRKGRKPKRSFKRVFSLLVVIILSTFLSTVVMHATNDVPFSESLLGFAFGGKSETTISRCPEGMTYVSSAGGSFCIDTYTASAGKNCPNLEPSSQSETRENISTSGCVPVSKFGSMPWRNISQTQAQEVCQKAGKFLSNGERWFHAARGTPAERPWGENDCNLNNNWLVNPGPTGDTERCVSYAGAYDMVGNVWEWVSDTVRGGVFDGETLPVSGYITSVDTTGTVLDTDPDNPDDNYTKDRFWINPEGVRGVMKGGFYGSGTDGGVYSTHAEMTPDFAGRAVGFRCASEVLR